MKKRTLAAGILLLLAIIAIFISRDYQCRKHLSISEDQLQDVTELKLAIQQNKIELSDKFDLIPFSPSYTASIASPACAQKRYPAETTIILGENVRRVAESLNIRLENQSIQEIWFSGDTFGFLLQSTEGWGFFRDYYHEVIFDPADQLKGSGTDCYPTIHHETLENGWKYRIVSSLWD